MRNLAHALGLAAALLLAAPAALADDERYMVERTAPFSQAELDQMLAPIALYPDSLLSQILMAATYPREVMQAASWARVHGYAGETAVRAAEDRPWDASVISLTAFPDVLAMMDERIWWTERLGKAYLAQPEQVMDTVQGLRARADAAGTLRSSEQIVVQRHGTHYIIETPVPEVVYVPYYDTRVVYGTWWWPRYQPVYWDPWPNYWYRRGYAGYCWGPRIVVGHGFFFGAIDWGHRHLRYGHHRPWYVRTGHGFHRGHRWIRHDREERADRGGHQADRGGRGDRRERERSQARVGEHGFFRPGGGAVPVMPAAAVSRPATPAPTVRVQPAAPAPSSPGFTRPAQVRMPAPAPVAAPVVVQGPAPSMPSVAPPPAPAAAAPLTRTAPRPASVAPVRGIPVERAAPAERPALPERAPAPPHRGGGRIDRF